MPMRAAPTEVDDDGLDSVDLKVEQECDVRTCLGVGGGRAGIARVGYMDAMDASEREVHLTSSWSCSRDSIAAGWSSGLKGQ